MDTSIYTPREDSFLILKHIKEYAEGNVLDMGTGSGILAIEAAKYADSVLAVDVNDEAVRNIRNKIRKNRINNIKTMKSDLFENMNKDNKFDLIMFNPPYLPDKPEVKDIALDGGRQGYELIERFLKKAKDFLSKEGRVLLLFSSLTKKGVLDRILKREGYSFKQVDSKKLDFEELYVYLIH